MQDERVKLNPELPWQKQHSNKKTIFSSQLDLNSREKLVKCYIWCTALCDAETWIFQQVDQKHLVRFELWKRLRTCRETDLGINEGMV